MASSGNLVSAHPGIQLSWQPFPFRSLQRRHVPLPELQAHLECSLRRQHVPLPLNLSPQKRLDTAHHVRLDPGHPPSLARFVFVQPSIQPTLISSDVTGNPSGLTIPPPRSARPSSPRLGLVATPPVLFPVQQQELAGSGIGDRQGKKTVIMSRSMATALDLDLGA